MEQKGLLISLPSILSWADTVHDRLIEETGGNKVIPRVAWLATGIASVVAVCFAALYNVLASPAHLIYTHISVTPVQDVPSPATPKEATPPAKVASPTKEATPPTKVASPTKEAAPITSSIQKSLEEQLTFQDTPLTSHSLQMIRSMMDTPQGRAYLHNNPQKMLCLLPCHNNNRPETKTPSTLSRQAIYQIQTNPALASRYLEGVLIFLKTLGFTLNAHGQLEKSNPDVYLEKAHMRVLTTAIISLGECGFGLFAKQILAAIRQETETGGVPRSFLRPAERALAMGTLATALPKEPNAPGTNPDSWWKKSHLVSQWRNYLNSNYFDKTQPPPQTKNPPLWFSLAQVLDNAPLGNLYPERNYQYYCYKGKTPLEIDPIFTGGSSKEEAPPLLIWHPQAKQWYMPFLG